MAPEPGPAEHPSYSEQWVSFTSLESTWCNLQVLQGAVIGKKW